MLDEPTDNTSSDTTEAATPPVKATRRRRATKAAAPAAEGGTTDAATGDPVASVLAEGAATPAADAPEPETPAPAKRVRKAPAKKAAPRKRAAAKSPAAPAADALDDEAAALGLLDGAEPVVQAVEDDPVVAAAAADDVTTDAVTPEPEATEVPADEPAAPAKRTRTRRVPAVVTFQPPEPAAAAPDDEDEPAPAPRRRRRASTAGAGAPGELVPELLEPTAPAPAAAATPDTADAGSDDDEDDPDRPRRRRRGRRGRGGARHPDEGDEAGESSEPGSAAEASSEKAVGDADPQDSSDDEDEDGEATSGTRRRRRRRRSGSGGAGAASETEDETPAREPRTRNRGGGGGGGGGNGATSADEDGVRGITGSTRMAAKRVRRQEGRDSGRKRQPILSEAEFLARREAVARTMVVRQQGDRTQIAVLEDGVLVEHYVTKASAQSYAGNVYLGRVQNVLPSMEAAFVDIGKGRNAVLYAGEVNYDGQAGGRSRSIESVLKSGQEVLVQVSKDPIGHKGARLTGQVSLPGRYLVYVPEGSMTGISRKLPEPERDRLKKILKKVVPDDAGVIIRTAAEGASEEEIAGDVRRLQAQWEVIQTKAAKGGAPVLLHAEPDLLIRVVRDVFNEDFAKLVVQGDTEWDTIRDYVEFVAPDLAPRLSRHTSERDVFAEHRIDEQLAKALDRKVWLPSGGSLVIDRTEAMVVIDVNTGKYVGKGGNLEETVTRNNLEAAEEIARQLRLRDLGGIIVVDFIDMVLESNRDLVVRRLVECLGRDRTKHQVAEVTSLGLVQMTRKRVGQGLLESFSEQCETCNGRGVLVSSEPVDEKRAGGDDRDRDRGGRSERPERGERGGRGGGRDKDKGPKGDKPEPAEKAAAKDDRADEAPAPDAVEQPAAAAKAGPTIEERPAATTPRRRRGGRGAGAAAPAEPAAPAEREPEPESVEADADDALVAATVEPDAAVDDAPVPVEPPTADEAPAPKRRRRATSRPAGPPAAG